MNMIQGSGGGKKKRSAPRPQPPVQQTVIVQQRVVTPTVSDDANSLFSKSSVRIVDLLSEGEIEGFVEAEKEKSVFFDDTVVRNDDGTDNFVYDDFEFREGLGPSDQLYIPGFSSSESVTQVNVMVGDAVGSSHVATVSDTNTDAITVQVLIPQLFVVSNGLKATTLSYLIEVQPSGGAYATKVEAVVSGKCTSPYERSHRIPLDGEGPWNVRLKRTEGVNDDNNNRRKIQFSSFTSIVEGKLRYPHSAVVGLRFDASQFQQIPTRSYDIKGIKVQIPSNATVDASNGSLTYSGVWDGQFQIAWCADPAWIMRDLIVSTRYGLGRFVSATEIDKWSLYAISKYCNELVSDGEGGEEPRFLCNVYMQSRDDAFSVVQDFASVFRGMAYWSAGQIAFSQDRPTDPVALFSNSNVVNGDFTYEGSSLKSRHTVALVTWNDPQNAYEQRVEYVSDEDAIAKYGVIETQVAAFGCTSRGQANRVGRWLLYSEQNETQTCTFSVGLDGAIVRPGQIIKVADQMRAGNRKGGRIASATTTQLILDSSTVSTPGDTISVVMPDGRVEQRIVDSANFDRKEINVTAAFSEAPNAETIYVLESTSIEAETFRVISVTEKDQQFQIVALEHNDTKYNFVEDGLALQPRDITILDETPATPTALSVDERLVEVNNAVVNEIEIAWRNVRNATGYKVSIKTENTLSFVTLGDTPYNNFTFTSNEIGLFTFRVSAISAIGKQSDPAVVSKSIAGLSAAPSNVSGFSMIPVNGQARLTWERSPDLDVRVGGHVLIRHSPDLSNATWANSTSISKEIAGSATEAYCDLKEGTYLIKFVDSGGRLSLGTSLVEFLKPDLQNLQNISTQTEHPNFTGTKTNLVLDGSANELLTQTIQTAGKDNQLQENGDEILQENGDIMLTEGDTNFASSATYQFAGNPITLSDVFSISLDSKIKMRGFRPDDIKLDEVADFDGVLDFDGDVPLNANARIYIRTTQDDPSGSPTYTSWREFNNAEFKARAFELKVETETQSGFDRIAISELQVTANLPIYSQTGTITTSTSADVTQTYANKFYLTPQVGIAFTTQSSGDYYAISNSAATGFDISVYNSSGTRVARQVSWTATGYGKG
jgi:predicted phage tail protein